MQLIHLPCTSYRDRAKGHVYLYPRFAGRRASRMTLTPEPNKSLVFGFVGEKKRLKSESLTQKRPQLSQNDELMRLSGLRSRKRFY